jgi:hypothetical protein
MANKVASELLDMYAEFKDALEDDDQEDRLGRLCALAESYTDSHDFSALDVPDEVHELVTRFTQAQIEFVEASTKLGRMVVRSLDDAVGVDDRTLN